MLRSCATVTREDAQRTLRAGEAKSADIKLFYDIVIVDASGLLLAFSRQDGGHTRLTGQISVRSGQALARSSEPWPPQKRRRQRPINMCFERRM